MNRYFNNTIKWAAVALAVVSMVSCGKFLTRDSKNQTTEEDWWRTKGQLSTVVGECYQAMNTGTIMANGDVKIPWNNGSTAGYANFLLQSKIENEGISDNGITCANYIDNMAITSGTLSSKSSNIANYWTGRYCSIRLCSRFLEHKDQAIFDPDKQPHEGIQTIDRWTGEIMALRAYYHMDLYMNYGPIPIIDHALTPAEQYSTRNTREECVTWIADQFAKAAELLPVKPQVSSEKWRWTKGACYAYISYLYMFENEWALARDWAKKVIELGIYDIYTSKTDPAHSYSEQFLHDAYTNDTKESILTRKAGCQQATVRLCPAGYISGGTGVCPTASLVDEYELLDGRTMADLTPEQQAELKLHPKSMARDPRLEQTVLFPRETYIGYTNNPWDPSMSNLDRLGARNSTKTGYYVKKWVNSTDTSKPYGSTLDFQLMRYAVVLLNYCEAQIELGDITDPLIYTYLNKIRSRAGLPNVNKTVYNSQEMLRELVRRERRVELAFEGHRIFDIRRWKIGDQVMNGTVYGALDPTTGELVVAETRSFNPARDYVWPIPVTEMTSNKNMTQNYGY